MPPLPSWPLLPTPTTHDSHGPQDARERVAKGRQVGLNDLAVTVFPLPRPGSSNRLLPTPMAQDSTGAQPVAQRGRQARLTDVAVTLFPLPNPRGEDKLLPTPRASDGTKGSANQRGSKGDLTLPSAVIKLITPSGGPRPKPKPEDRPPAGPDQRGPS
jgi:DNA (cytosine-5)-methyltransferase 1